MIEEGAYDCQGKTCVQALLVALDACRNTYRQQWVRLGIRVATNAPRLSSAIPGISCTTVKDRQPWLWAAMRMILSMEPRICLTVTAWQSALKTPDFSFAIFSSVLPKDLTWSRPMLPTAGVSTASNQLAGFELNARQIA